MTDKNLPVLPKRKRKLKHLLWVDFKNVKLDGRTALAKAIRLMRSELTKHVGGTPSIAEAILIERAVFKSVKCYLYETNYFSDKEQGSTDHYLALGNSLRHDLLAIGLKPATGEKIVDLKSYVDQKYGSQEK